jgi:diaminopropionate ammonia-lyase
VLGGMVAGLRAIARHTGAASLAQLLEGHVLSLALPRLICASDGNHGLAVAAAAQRVGAEAVVFLPAAVSRARAARISAVGGTVAWVRGTYDDAVRQAVAAADRGEGLLIADTSADEADPVVRDVMAGYALLTGELVEQFASEAKTRPSHLFVQAGVGGLAAAMAEGLRTVMRQPCRLLVVEPETAACVARALDAGHPVPVRGSLHTAAEMLSCGIASAPALAVLKRHDVRSVIVGDEALRDAVRTLRASGGPATTPSGAAGLAGLLRLAEDSDLRRVHQLDASSEVLLVATEGPAPE